MQFRTGRLRRRRRFGFCPFRCCCRGFPTHGPFFRPLPLKLRPRPRLSVLHTIADGLADWSAGGGVSRRESKASIALYFRAVVVVDDGVEVAAVEACNGDVKDRRECRRRSWGRLMVRRKRHAVLAAEAPLVRCRTPGDGAQRRCFHCFIGLLNREESSTILEESSTLSGP